MAYTEAKEQFGKMLRWSAQAKDQKQHDETVFMGEVIEGWYVKKRTEVGQNDSNVYEFMLKNRELVSMWGSALLDGKFDLIPLGSEVRVTFLGIAQPKTPGGRPYQNFRVEFDKDSRMPANFAEAAPAPATAAPSAPATGGYVPPAAQGAFVPPAGAPAGVGVVGNGF